MPMGIAVSKFMRNDHRLVYANKTFESLTGRPFAEIGGRGWIILDTFAHEDDATLTIGDAMLKSEDCLGTFRTPAERLVEVYAGIIENEDGSENYRIAALIDVTERERSQRDAFARQIREKDLLLKEIQHRVRNNLQLIVALIRLDIRSQRSGEPIDLERLTSRIQSLQTLYQALSSDGFGQTVDLAHYLSEIASALMHTYAVDGIRLDLKVDHSPVSVNVALPLGLIVNELLTNAFKYAFGGRDGGTLILRCLRADDSYTITVADDGVGFPEQTSWPAPNKLGSLLVQSLRENVKGTLELKLETARGTGSRITIAFRHNPPQAN
jgi:PAS domain S-box-containing protein